MTDLAISRERILLGALMLDNAQIRNVSLTASDFLVTTHGQVFEAIRRLIGTGKVADAVTVSDLLHAETTRNGWLELTAQMMRECLSPSNATAYADSIRKASIARQAARVGESLQQGGSIDDAIRELIALSNRERDYACHVLEAMQETMDDLSRIANGAPRGVRTGIKDLDAALGGMHDEDLIIVAARPAMGKTAFALNLALSANCGVGIFSGEQGRAQIGMRMLAIDGSVSLHKMRTAKLDDDEWDRIYSAISSAKNRPIWIYDRPSPTISEVIAQARAWKFHQNIGVLIIDYLQKLRGGQGENFRLQVGDITAQLKDLARELKIPVVALAQVKREVESRPMGADGLGRMPYMSDIAEASIIEQEADQIITLYRPEVYDDSPRHKGIAYANVCKNRHGPIGHICLSWRGEYLKFGDLAKHEIALHGWSAA
jgi:replicative DNA helicase